MLLTLLLLVLLKEVQGQARAEEVGNTAACSLHTHFHPVERCRQVLEVLGLELADTSETALLYLAHLDRASLAMAWEHSLVSLRG